MSGPGVTTKAKQRVAIFTANMDGGGAERAMLKLAGGIWWAIDEIYASVGGDVIIAAACPAKLREALVAAYRRTGDDEPAPVVPIAVAPPPPPETEPEPEPEGVFRVVATVGAERIDLAHCPTRASAEARMHELAAELAAGSWLSCKDRLVRAESVVSLEIVETAVTQ